MGRKRHELTGRKFGKLLVQEYVGRGKNSEAMWLCKCDCGKMKTVSAGHLMVEAPRATLSCGCIQAKQRSSMSKIGNKAESRNGKPLTSKYKGVSYTNRNKWEARLRYEGKDVLRARFETEVEAAKVYNEYAKKYFKECANLNIIK